MSNTNNLRFSTKLDSTNRAHTEKYEDHFADVKLYHLRSICSVGINIFYGIEPCRELQSTSCQHRTLVFTTIYTYIRIDFLIVLLLKNIIQNCLLLILHTDTPILKRLTLYVTTDQNKAHYNGTDFYQLQYSSSKQRLLSFMVHRKNDNDCKYG